MSNQVSCAVSRIHPAAWQAYDKNRKKYLLRNIPVRSTSLILAGIRADKLDHLTFPCTLHSGNEGWLTAFYFIKKEEKTQRLYTVAGAAHFMQKALCFPFNRRHEHVREHQNSAILKPGRLGGKVYRVQVSESDL